jgi:hypothetical protein
MIQINTPTYLHTYIHTIYVVFTNVSGSHITKETKTLMFIVGLQTSVLCPYNKAENTVSQKNALAYVYIVCVFLKFIKLTIFVLTSLYYLFINFWLKLDFMKGTVHIGASFRRPQYVQAERLSLKS